MPFLKGERKVFMRIMIKEHMPVTELMYCGYDGAVLEGDTLANVTRIGIIHPAILFESEAPYGPVIRDLREKAGMRLDDFARRMRMGIEEVSEIEKGFRSLSDHEMNLIANIFHVRSDALRHARVTLRRSDLEEEIKKTHELFDRLKQELTEQIERFDKACGNERFFVKPASEEEFYLIYDAEADDFVKDKDGALLSFASPLAALDAAYRLERDERIKVHPEEKKMRVEIREMRQKFSCVKEGDKVYVYEGTYPDKDGADTLAAVYSADGGETILSDLSDDTRHLLEGEALRMFDKGKEPAKEAPVML